MGSRDPGSDPIQLPFHATTSSPFDSTLQRSASFNQHGRARAVTPSDSSLGNLNRWSKSTSSSTHSHSQSHHTHSHKRSNSLSLRIRTSETKDLASASPPRKLLKKRPSTSGSPAAQIKVIPPAFDASSLTLPPIKTLPALQTSVGNASSPLTGPFTPSPSTAQVVSALNKTVPDYFAAWDEKPRDFSQYRSPTRSRSARREPSPILAPQLNSVVGKAYSTDPIEDLPGSRGHSRHRSQAGKSSGGTGSSSRSSKQPSQKAMLSKALQKANTAVLLDNAQNFEGAMQAYSEACSLLQQVMGRSSGDDDRRKLEAIRNTYTSRISELTRIAPHLRDDGKALPARPESGEFRAETTNFAEDDEDHAVIETATVTRIVNDQSYAPEYPSRSLAPSQVPQRRESLLPSAMDHKRGNPGEPYLGRSYSRSPMRERTTDNNLSLAPPMESIYMPPPLSPRRPSSPMSYDPASSSQERQQPTSELPSSSTSGISSTKAHKRAPSNESMSWLDTIDESGGSTASSIHSRTSSQGFRRKHIRAASGATEAEFDAALDAAVEAAYDDGYEPVDDRNSSRYDYDDDDEIVANVRRKVELAKERVRQSEREAAIQDARDKERKRLLQQSQRIKDFDDDYDANESEEEERMLEEMTRGYVLDDFEFGLQSKSALPRESDSSGFSGRTWNSSIGSNLTTAGTPLSTVTEAAAVPQIPVQLKAPLPLHPPPSQALPLPPMSASQSSLPSQGVRSRRLSGQNAKQLKIETVTKAASAMPPPLSQPPSGPPPRIPTDTSSNPPRTVNAASRQQPQVVTNRPPLPQASRQASSPFPNSAEAISPPTPNLTQVFTNDSDGNGPISRSGSPARTQSRTGLRKNFSSSSLKNLKGRNLSVSEMDNTSDLSPNTPLSSQFTPGLQTSRGIPAMPSLPTPIAAAFKDKMNGAPSGGLYLFSSDLHSPESPGSPNRLYGGAPIPLEPCPTEFLLRPFWLMRALYQTITHPRGGYLSTKLFVPRDVWRVKGVKLKAVEDKIANCDFLTAALLKLAQVDTFDADAVLEEMQSLEGVLEQVQTTLAKKLGSEVGVQGSGGMFKDASSIDAESTSTGAKSGSVSSKSSTFSWRRLRTKNSGVGLANNYSNKTPVEGPKDGMGMGTLPMTTTSLAKVRFSKRDVTQIQFSGPNANYMSSLARLFDAAQTLDQIARQVEDPGLRHADKTQVGLELCTRHAAEFFGFYICRFVLNDIGMLLDKFIKRGSEWVLV